MINCFDHGFWTLQNQEKLHNSHPTESFPTEFAVSEAEARMVRNENFKSNLAMNVSEISRLSENELVLFPAKDFWDAKRRTWKSTKAGAWAKAQSEKVKDAIGKDNFK